MSGEATTVLQQAMNLAPVERYEVAQHLLDSLGKDELPEDQEFWDEITRRSDEAHEHPERLLDAKDAITDMRAELARRRAARLQENAS